MASCDNCGDDLSGLDYTCSKCEGTFCTKCRLPESHDCMGLKVEKAERELKREAGETEAWFKSGEDSTQQENKKGQSRSRLLYILLVVIIILIAGAAITLL